LKNDKFLLIHSRKYFGRIPNAQNSEKYI